eukprot:4477870-Lingulodinium_polyedra.AAC.1
MEMLASYYSRVSASRLWPRQRHARFWITPASSSTWLQSPSCTKWWAPQARSRRTVSWISCKASREVVLLT